MITIEDVSKASVKSGNSQAFLNGFFGELESQPLLNKTAAYLHLEKKAFLGGLGRKALEVVSKKFGTWGQKLRGVGAPATEGSRFMGPKNLAHKLGGELTDVGAKASQMLSQGKGIKDLAGAGAGAAFKHIVLPSVLFTGAFRAFDALKGGGGDNSQATPTVPTERMTTTGYMPPY